MKTHTTNYFNAFIQVADDCPALVGEIPPSKDAAKSVATMQFEIVMRNPYTFTSDDVLFRVFAERNDITPGELAAARAQFFSKGQPCFRASPLTKRYGWGLHSDADGRIALYGRETKEYQRLSEDSLLKVIKAMKSTK
jgi:hypothetical protein